MVAAEENRARATVDGEGAAEAGGEAQPRLEAEDVQLDGIDVRVEEEIDELSMVELVPQPEIEVEPDLSLPLSELSVPPAEVEAVVSHDSLVADAVQEASPAVVAAVAEERDAGEEKKHRTSSGIALPSFVERGATGVFDAVGTKTGIPLPPRADDEPQDQAEAEAAVIPAADEQCSDPQHTEISEAHAEQAVEEAEEEQFQARAEFSDADDYHTQADDHHTQAEVEYAQTEMEEPQEEAWSASQLSTALTASSLLSFEPLADLPTCPHLYQALLAIKGVWQSKVSMDELIVAAARAEQSDRHNEEVKNWYAMRIKKLVVNALDFVWISCAYDIDVDGLLVIDDERLFTALTGITASDFRELCSRGFINRNDLSALVQQFKLWEVETDSPADYILLHLRRERMAA